MSLLRAPDADWRCGSSPLCGLPVGVATHSRAKDAIASFGETPPITRSISVAGRLARALATERHWSTKDQRGPGSTSPIRSSLAASSALPVPGEPPCFLDEHGQPIRAAPAALLGEPHVHTVSGISSTAVRWASAVGSRKVITSFSWSSRPPVRDPGDKDLGAGPRVASRLPSRVPPLNGDAMSGYRRRPAGARANLAVTGKRWRSWD